MADSEPLLDLSSFVPNIVKQKLVSQPGILTQPSMERFAAAVLFADITGFTALTEQLATQGPEGVETISHILNEYFTKMVETIHAHGGDVVKFAGDALLAVWRKDQQADAALQAAACALTLQQNLNQYSPAENISLRIRIGLGAGEAVIAFVGGMMQRWEFVVTGDPVIQASFAQTNARPGQVAISPEMREQLGNHAVLDGDGSTLLSLAAPAQKTDLRHLLQISAAQVPALQTYIPRAIVSRLSAGQAAWMAELRRVTVLFIELPGFGQMHDQATQQKGLSEAQSVLHALQEILYRYEGSANKISVDDKGVMLLAAMGLPPFSHSDDPLRGVLAALDSVEKMKELGLLCRVGIATGRAFCGSIGSSERREYTMIGRVVNLAARLKAAASTDKTNLNIFCDTTTQEACAQHIRFESLPAVKVKGIDQPVPIFSPLERLRGSVRSSGNLVGRMAEKAALAAPLTGLKTGKGQVLVLEGEAGMGKSRLVEDLLQSADRADVRILVGAGDAIEKSASYYPWRPIFRQLFGLEDALNGMEAGRQGMVSLTSQQVDGILASFAERLPEMVDRAPLLEAVLPIALPDNHITRHMSGLVRAQDTQRLLIGLIEQVTRNSPTLLVLEDAHWLDSASWALVRAVAEELPNIYLLIVNRPMGDPLPSDYQQLTQVPGVQFIRLQPMSVEDALSLVSMRLNVHALPAEISDLIVEKAEGHPFFSEELAYALRDAHLIKIENGECTLNASMDEIESIIPNTVEGVITSRIDLLTPQQQLTLKVASVIGRVFALRVLREIHPIDSDRPLLEEHLLRLQQLDLTPLDTPSPDLAYIFKHIITQQVAYNLMLFAQRKQLHRNVAEWHERAYHEELSPYYPLLAHHYTHAEDYVKATQYLAKAGEQALLKFANQEAVGFLSEALRLVSAEQPKTPAAKLEKAHWESWLGQAYLGMGDLPHTKEHLYRSLELLDRPMPTTNLGVALDILGQAIHQIFHLAFPGWLVVNSHGATPPTAIENDRLMAIFKIYDMLFEIFYFATDLRYLVLTGLNSTNIAERATPFGGRAKALIGMSAIVGVIGLNALAQRYQKQALEISVAYDDLPVKNWVSLVFSLHKIGVSGVTLDVLLELIAVEKSYESIRDRRHWAEARGLLAQCYFYEGEYQKNIALSGELYSRVQKSNEIQQKMWALLGQGRCFLVMGDAPKAIQTLLDADDCLTKDTDQTSEISIVGLLAHAYWQTGEREKLHQMLARSLKIITSVSLRNLSSQTGFEYTTNTVMDLLEEQAAHGQSFEPALLKNADEILRASRIFARSFPIHLPNLYRNESRYLWLRGKPKAARSICQKSLDLARLYHLPHAEAMALFELGRHSLGEEKRALLEQASIILTRIGANYDLQRMMSDAY